MRRDMGVARSQLRQGSRILPKGVYHRILQVTGQSGISYKGPDGGVALGVSGLFIQAHLA